MLVDDGDSKHIDEIPLLKAWARLKAFRQNVPSGPIEESYVTEYRNILHAIEQLTGHELGDFLLPNGALRPIVTGRHSQHQTTQSHSRFCDSAIFLRKLDAAIIFFGAVVPEESKRQIGF